MAQVPAHRPNASDLRQFGDKLDELWTNPGTRASTSDLPVWGMTNQVNYMAQVLAHRPTLQTCASSRSFEEFIK
jgi:hypothetical protein